MLTKDRMSMKKFRTINNKHEQMNRLTLDAHLDTTAGGAIVNNHKASINMTL